MAKVDPEITWITLEEARRAWGFKSTRGFHFGRKAAHLRMRKSGGTWLVKVKSLIKHYGEPRQPIMWDWDERVSE